MARGRKIASLLQAFGRPGTCDRWFRPTHSGDAASRRRPRISIPMGTFRSAPARSSLTRRTLDTNNVHHAQILVVKYVTVKDEIANVRPPEVNTECDARVRVAEISIPGRHLDHVQVLADNRGRLRVSIELEVVLGFDQKVKLVEVKLVVFERPVLDDPLFHSSLGGHDVGRKIACLSG
jgi:hypothetical protein